MKYFLAVAQKGSISKAAEYLYITQPTLSKQLMELEAQLGKKLFARGTKKITLTNEGVFLRARAQEIIDLVNKTQSELKIADESTYGQLRIGSNETALMKIIAPAADKVRKNCPDITFSFFCGNEEMLTELFDRAMLDFAIIIGNADTKVFDCLKLNIHKAWGLIMRKDWPLAALECITPDIVANIPILAPSQPSLYSELSGWLGGDFEKLGIIANYNLINAALPMIEAGLGYGLCLEGLVDIADNGPLCFRPLMPALNVQINLIYKRHGALSLLAKKVLSQIQEGL